MRKVTEKILDIAEVALITGLALALNLLWIATISFFVEGVLFTSILIFLTLSPFLLTGISYYKQKLDRKKKLFKRLGEEKLFVLFLEKLVFTSFMGIFITCLVLATYFVEILFVKTGIPEQAAFPSILLGTIPYLIVVSIKWLKKGGRVKIYDWWSESKLVPKSKLLGWAKTGESSKILQVAHNDKTDEKTLYEATENITLLYQDKHNKNRVRQDYVDFIVGALAHPNTNSEIVSILAQNAPEYVLYKFRNHPLATSEIKVLVELRTVTM